MNRLQALLLALEISAIVWMGAFLGGKWLARQGDPHHGLEVSENFR